MNRVTNLFTWMGHICRCLHYVNMIVRHWKIPVESSSFFFSLFLNLENNCLILLSVYFQSYGCQYLKLFDWDVWIKVKFPRIFRNINRLMRIFFFCLIIDKVAFSIALDKQIFSKPTFFSDGKKISDEKKLFVA